MKFPLQSITPFIGRRIFISSMFRMKIFFSTKVYYVFVLDGEWELFSHEYLRPFHATDIRMEDFLYFHSIRLTKPGFFMWIGWLKTL